MSATVQEMSSVKISPSTVKDNGKVRIGMVSPTFPPVTIKDTGKVRMGFATPAFPPVRIEQESGDKVQSR